jgi:hypothetical protein
VGRFNFSLTVESSVSSALRGLEDSYSAPVKDDNVCNHTCQSVEQYAESYRHYLGDVPLIGHNLQPKRPPGNSVSVTKSSKEAELFTHRVKASYHSSRSAFVQCLTGLRTYCKSVRVSGDSAELFCTRRSVVNTPTQCPNPVS